MYDILYDGIIKLHVITNYNYCTLRLGYIITITEVDLNKTRQIRHTQIKRNKSIFTQSHKNYIMKLNQINTIFLGNGREGKFINLIFSGGKTGRE